MIGPAEAIPALRERLDSGGAEMHTFTDAQALEALDLIIRSKPRIVALDDAFSATSRGTALITRIKEDPNLLSCELRVIAHNSAASRVAVRRSPSGVGIATAVHEPRPALDQRGTRRAVRIHIRDGVEVLIDGNATTLVDLSQVGAQVLSARTLKPNQRVRVALSDGKGTVRCQALIAWASFEMPKGEPTRYRAGVEFTATDPEAVAAYAERHKKC